MAIYFLLHDYQGTVYAVMEYDLITVIRDYDASVVLLETPTNRRTYLFYVGVNEGLDGA